MTKRKRELREPSPASALVAAIARSLDERGVRYLLIGGQAVNQQGYARTTEDIDIELALGPWDLDLIRPLVAELDLHPKFPTAFQFVQRSLLLPLENQSGAIGVDFAFSPSEYLDLAIARAPRHEIAGYPVAVAAVEDLILRKLIANRPQDLQDIDELLLRHTPKLDRAYLETWLANFEEVTNEPLRARFAECLQRSRE